MNCSILKKERKVAGELKQINVEHKINSNSIYIVPIGDIHIGHKSFNDKYLNQALKFVKKNRDRCRIFILGDVLESATKTSVGRAVYEEKMHLQDQLDEAVRIFQPYADLIDIIVTGNHEERIAKDTSLEVLREFAYRIGREDAYSEFCGVVNVKLKNLVYSSYVWHGATGAIRESTVVTAILKMREKVISHLYFMGHTHKLFSLSSEIAIPNFETEEVTVIKQLFVNTGSSLENSGYAEQKGYPFHRLGYGAVEIFANERKMVFHYIEDLI